MLRRFDADFATRKLAILATAQSLPSISGITIQKLKGLKVRQATPEAVTSSFQNRKPSAKA